MKWITREKVKVDRVACPWLIKNFVDKDAEFVFVPGFRSQALFHSIVEVKPCLAAALDPIQPMTITHLRAFFPT
jgi:Chromate resistance exported protein